MGENANNKGLIIAGFILGLSLVVAAGLGSYTFYQVKSFDNTLSVTGSAKQRITSDAVKWTGVYERTVPADQLKRGYEEMRADTAKVSSFLKESGVADAEVTFSPVQLEEPYKYSQGLPKEYALRQTVTVSSGEVDKITALAKSFQPLIDAGVVFSTQGLEYYYTKLPDLRVALLSEAVKDAKTRAERIAASNGQAVGTLRSASMGVVQVMQVNSTDVSDYGTYDTSGIEKEVMITVRTAFTLK